MNKNFLQFNNLTINENESIDGAMKAITDNKCGAVIVVDDNLVFKRTYIRKRFNQYVCLPYGIFHGAHIPKIILIIKKKVKL